MVTVLRTGQGLTAGRRRAHLLDDGCREEAAPGRRADPQHLVVSRGRTIRPKTLEPEAVRRRDRQAHRGLRDRPGRHRQDLPGGGQGGAGAAGQAGQPDHPDPAGGRGRGAARLPARDAEREDRPVPAAAVRRPARHARSRSRSPSCSTAGTIEVAPLAYMRGRAQPYDATVLTPDGFRRRSVPCGSAISSSAPMAGSRRPCSASTHRARSRSTASRRRTAPRPSAAASTSGRSRPLEGTSGGWTHRVLETQEMIGKLRRGAHTARFEIPDDRRPYRSSRHKTSPLDAYALGLLLGDGCISRPRPTPTFCHGRPELAHRARGVAGPHRGQAQGALRLRFCVTARDTAEVSSSPTP